MKKTLKLKIWKIKEYVNYTTTNKQVIFFSKKSDQFHQHASLKMYIFNKLEYDIIL